MQNLENLDVFEILIKQKTAKMPEGPFCQIGAQLFSNVIRIDSSSGEPSQMCSLISHAETSQLVHSVRI